MNDSSLVPDYELFDRLDRLGYKITGEDMQLSTIWKHVDSGQEILVPKAEGGLYPANLVDDLERHIQSITV